MADSAKSWLVRLLSRPAFRTWLFAIGAIAYGVGKSFILPPSLAGSPQGVLAGALIVAIGLWYAYATRLTREELGLAPWIHAPRSLGWAVVAIVVPVIAAAGLATILAALHVPPLKVPLVGDLVALTPEQLRMRIFAYLPLDTVLPEELTFRAVLWADLRRQHESLRWPLLGSTLAFALWHAGLAIQESGSLLRFGVACLVYLLGGLLFALPRAGGHVAGCMLAHWMADSLLYYTGNPAGQWLRDLILRPIVPAQS